jgi:TP901 family phage tail tape measure protein
LANPAKLSLEIGAKVGASFSKSIRKAQRQMLTFNEKVKRSINDTAAGATKGFKNVIRNDAFQGAAVAAGGLGLALKGAIGTAMNFEKSMQAVKAVTTDLSDRDFVRLQDEAKRLGRTTQFSASEASAGMEKLAQAGLNAEQMLVATGPALNLAAAGGIELSQAANIATNVMGGMALKVGDLNMVNDVLAKTSSSANTNVLEMGQVFEKVGGVAPNMGVSIQQISAMAGVLANSGIKGAEAGTAMKTAMLRMASEKTAIKAMKELGVSATDAQGDMRQFPDILRDMGSQMEALGLSESKRADIQKRVFGLRAAASGAILQEAAANGDLAKMIDTVTNSEGTAEEQAKTRMKGLAGSVKKLQSAAEGLAIAFGGPLLAPLAAVAETMAAVLGPVAGLLGDMPILATLLGAVAAAFIGLVIAMPIIGAITGAVAAFKLTMIGAWVATLGPVALVIAAVAVVASIFMLLYKRVEPFRNFVDAIWNEVKFATKSIIKWFGKLPKRIGKIVKNIGMRFENFFAELRQKWTAFTDFVGAVVEFIGGVIMAAVHAYIRPWLWLFGQVRGLWNKLLDWIGNLPIVQAGKELIDKMLKGIQEGWTAFTAWITEKVEWIKSLNPFKNWRLGSAEKDALGQAGNVQPGAMGSTYNPHSSVSRGPGPISIPQAPGIGLVTPLPARARGGPVSSGQSYLVGERGPELFQPSRSGQILSNRQTMGAELFQPSQAGAMLANRSASMSMAPTININVANSNASPEDIAAAVARGLDDALMEAEAGVRALLND